MQEFSNSWTRKEVLILEPRDQCHPVESECTKEFSSSHCKNRENMAVIRQNEAEREETSWLIPSTSLLVSLEGMLVAESRGCPNLKKGPLCNTGKGSQEWEDKQTVAPSQC